MITGSRIAAALVVAGCATGRPASSPSPSTARGTVEIAWRRDDLRPVQRARAAGGVVAGIVTTPDRRLRLVALDAATGATRWERPLTPSFVTAGVAVDVAIVGGDKIAYLRPSNDDTGYARLVIADAATGEDRAVSPDAAFTSLPRACGADACATSAASLGDRIVAHRLELATGRYVPEGDTIPAAVRDLGDGLLDLRDRGEAFAVARDGRLLWQTPVAAAFPEGFTSNHGWRWRLDAGTGAYIGAIGGPWLARDGDRLTIDLEAATAMAALSATTGRVLWRDAGSWPVTFGEHEPPPPLRRRVRGVGTYERGVPVALDGVDVTLEAFDPATGKTTWSVPLGAAESLVAGVPGPPLADATHLVVRRRVGAVIVDLATGAAAPAPPGATYWCGARAEYEHWMGYQLARDEPMRFTRRGGELATICDADGRPATPLPDAAATFATGARAGDFAVLATGAGFVALRRR